MARIVTTTETCDRDGRPVAPGTEPRMFVLDGQGYEIDLCAACSAELDGLAALVAASGREVPGGKRRRTAAERRETAAIRGLARAAGWPVADKGRLPKAATERFRAAA